MVLYKPVSDRVAQELGDRLGVDWSKVTLREWVAGLEVELEHGTVSADTDVTHDDARLTGMIALAHLREHPQYYTRLRAVEQGTGYMGHRI